MSPNGDPGAARGRDSVALPEAYLEAGHLTHAITGHEAQGMTTDRAFVLGDSLYREWGLRRDVTGPRGEPLVRGHGRCG